MIARGYVEAGATVYISSRKKDVCDEMAAELSKLGTCVSLPADLATEAACIDLAAEIASRESQAPHPRQQRGRHVGRAARRVPRRRVGQGARPQREVAVLPDPRARCRSSKPRRPPTIRRA